MTIALWVIGALLVAAQPVPAKGGSGVAAIEPARVEAEEDLTEEVANELLRFSAAVKARDVTKMGSFLADRLLSTPMPGRPGPLADKVKWIAEHGWQPSPGGERSLDREAFLADLSAFLSHFREIDDARFKVKDSEATLPAAVVAGHMKFFIVGRDVEGRREKASGTGDFRARRLADGRWRFERFSIETVQSKVASTDLFSEVSGGAGIAQTDPPFAMTAGSRIASHGAAAADVNADGLIDLFVTGSPENRLYLNLGDGRFADAALEARVKYPASAGSAPLFLDHDNDGDLDLFISSIGPQMLYENRLVPDGTLVFREISHESGVARPAIGFSAVAGDIDGNGLPDIYVASYNYYGEVAPDAWDGASNGTPNLLFVNRGQGVFEEAAAKWGAADARWSYAAAFSDVDEDGDLDLYVANDFGGGNALLMNQRDRGEGRFLDAAEQRGVLDRGYGMGVSWGDYDNDGDLDLHVTQMSSTAGARILKRIYPEASRSSNLLLKIASGNTLFENLGAGKFRDVSEAAGGFPAGWAWGGGFLDFDNDGWEDIHVPNGFISGKSMKDT